jgi:hypothetical protein
MPNKSASLQLSTILPSSIRAMSIPPTLTEELLEEAALGDGVICKLHGDLAYKSEALKEALA